MRFLYCLIFPSFLLLFGRNSCTAQVAEQLQFKHLTVESGLPSAIVSCLYKDKAGFLWIGTHSGGIARFDGQRLKHFPMEKVYEIISIIEDLDGNIYAGTNAGLFVLKKEASSFQKIVIAGLVEEEEGCWTNVVYIDKNNKLWLSFTCQWGLYTLDLKTFALVKVIDTIAERLSIYPKKPFETVKWCVSVASEGFVLTHFENDKAVRSEAQLNDRYDLPKFNIANHFMAENDSIIWLGSTLGLLRFNIKTKQLGIFNTFKGQKITNFVRPNFINDSLIVVGTEANGLLFFDKNRQKFVQAYTHHAAMPKGISSNHLDDVFVDNEQNIFAVAPSYGIDYATFAKPIFQNIFTKKEAFDKGLGDNDITFAIENNREDIYLGTKMNGILIMPKNGKLQLFPQNAQLRNKTINTLFFTDSTPNSPILVGTNGGLQLFSGKNVRNILENEIVYSVSQYDKNTYFVSTFNNLYVLNLIGNRAELQAVKGVAEGAHRYNWNVFFDAAHTPFALLEYGNLLATLVYKNKHWELGQSKWLPLIVVNAPPSVQNNIATFCTYKGLLKVNLADFSWSIQSEIQQNALSQAVKFFYWNENEYFTITDKNTYYVLDGQATHYSTSDGLSSNHFEAKACFLLKNGDLFLGGNNGGNIFKRQKKSTKNSLKEVIFTDILLNDSLEIRLTNSFLNLPYDKNTLTIAFAHTDFTLPNTPILAYRLKNFDTHWLPSTPAATVRYGNLPEGNYVFEVRYKDSDKILKQIWIKIEPPFYRQYWFVLACFSGILACFYLFFRAYLKHIKKEARQKSEFERLKIEAETKALRAQMNPHFIFNCINTIDGYILTNQPLLASAYLQKFSKLVRLVFQNSQYEQVAIEEDIQALDLYLQLETERFDNSFAYSFDISAAILKNKATIAPLLIQPFVENAILHGLRPKKNGRGYVNIALVEEKNAIRITIDDNGIGREKAAFLKQNRVEVHKSRGIQVTLDRLKTLEMMYNYDADFKIIDKIEGTTVSFLVAN